MASVERRYPKEEFARRGDELFDRVVRPGLAPVDNGKYVALDIDTGEFEIDADQLAAIHRLHARLPQAQVWLVRVGSPSLRRFGGRDVDAPG
jgi:hypothetical protein